MRVISFNFTKMSIEKKGVNFKDLSIKSRVNIINLEKAKIEKEKKDSFLIVKWEYSINYSPNIANIDFEGNILVELDKKKVDEILDLWKNKKFDDEFNLFILNLIIKKSSIKAVELEDEFGLPTHFKLPGFKLSDKSEK